MAITMKTQEIMASIEQAMEAHFNLTTQADDTAATTAEESMSSARTSATTPPFSDSHLYMVKEAFSQSDLYWKDRIRVARFETTLRKGILYRPVIVDELILRIEECFEADVKKGVMVKGPHGVGKSHTLVNLVRKLLYGSQGQYHVTFIPDCEQWHDASEFLDAICESFGCTRKRLGLELEGNQVKDLETLSAVLEIVDSALAKRGKQWVFVFDQINKLFVKRENLHARDASGLDFPFYFIKEVMKPGRIVSVISASVDNELSYKERHEGFAEYMHNVSMTEIELCNSIAEITSENVEEVFDVTAGVPLYATSFVEEHKLNADAFTLEVNEAVSHSLLKLQKESQTIAWDEIVNTILSTLLLSETREKYYDKKYFIQERLAQRYRYHPLIPAVLSSCREIFWKQLMRFVEEHERSLLAICKNPSTTNRVRGCHFETMVIRRFSSAQVELQVGENTVTIRSGAAVGFPGRLLPTGGFQNGVHFPFDPNFPAIDFFLIQDRSVFAIQVHVSNHSDVISSFAGLCAKANWFERFDRIELIYLSPEDGVRDLVQKLVNPPEFEVRLRNQDEAAVKRRFIVRRALSKNYFACLCDLQWPEGCSLW